VTGRWEDQAPPLDDDGERAWQEQLIRWQEQYDLLRAMARIGRVDLKLLADCRRLAREHQADVDDDRRDQLDWDHPRWRLP
jgi:hypothetical protein